MMAKIHEVKLHAKYFDLVLEGKKRAEFRKNDRNYERGDTLILHEWVQGVYTGRKVEARIAEFSISLATGRADIYTETPVKVSGFKRVIDEQDWTITKVTHFLNNSGFTTSLELEVRLSDVEYETEDDE